MGRGGRHFCLLGPLGALLLAAWAGRLPAQTPGGSSGAICQSQAAVVDAKAAVARDPEGLGPRLRLADTLVDAGCYQEATSALEAGEEMHPHSNELERKLRDVRSMVTEQHYFEGLGEAEESAKLQRNLLRCTKLADLAACDEALKIRPDDLQILLSKGDALLQGNHAADAVIVYRRASVVSPGNEAIKMKVATAQVQRQSLVSQCENGSGAAAVEACDAALLHGAEDEFEIDRREGILLQSVNEPEQALDAYIAASVLKQDNQSVALAVVALTQSTGREDAMALQALGAALLTLGRPTDALAALTQAQTLTPTLPGIGSQIEKARRLALLAPQRTGSGLSAAATGATPKASAAARRKKHVSEALAQQAAQQPTAQVASTAPTDTRAYSNDAPDGRTN
jgi:tetratricopeptide (TPR) repeat protein